MKKTILSMFAAAMSITATAQTDIWYWQDGKVTK